MTHRPRLALAAILLLLPLAPATGADPATPTAPPPAAPAPAPARAEAGPWTVALEQAGPLQRGVPAAATIRLAARDGHHVNLEYPAAFKPDPQATVAFGGARVALAVTARRPCAGRPDETCELEWALPFTPGPPPVRLSGTVLFSVCTAERCLIERVALGLGR